MFHATLIKIQKDSVYYQISRLQSKEVIIDRREGYIIIRRQSSKTS